MESFLSRKKRKLSPVGVATSQVEGELDDESTEFKLAMLSSLHPYTEQQVLLDILLAHEGSVERASGSLANPSETPKKPSVAALGRQQSLSDFVSFPYDGSAAKKAKLLSRKGRTLHLYSPEDVAHHTPCSIIHNFLPAEEANALLEELLQEAPSFEKTSFKLFDNIVQSPHTSSFYVNGLQEIKRQKTEYLYNGALLTDIRQLTPQMTRVSPKVEEAVNTEISNRTRTHYPGGKKLRYQSSDPWKPNAAFVNCYSGGAESVGYHSDQLTYLGPRAIIGSISLGVAREFRVRRVVPQGDAESTEAKPKDSSDAEGQIAIHLPHNSLLVMHAEMQEEWKHSIAPAQTIDPHPVAGNRRINITYRDYKPYLHPKFTPKCKCQIPCVLRVVQRKKENWGKYFWMCHAGNVPDKEGCTFFEWAQFDDDGRPIWSSEADNTTKT